jgi:hypothetical protein
MQTIDATFDQVPFAHGRRPRRGALWLLPWGVAMVFGAGMGVWSQRAHAPAAPQIIATAAPTSAPIPVNKSTSPYGNLENPYGGLVNPYGPLVDYFQIAKPALASASPALQASLEAMAPAAGAPQPQEFPLPPKRDTAILDEAAPLPPHRPAGLAPLAQPDRAAPQAGDKVAAAPAPVDDRNIFEKLFGTRPNNAAPNSATVAYAEPETHAVTAAKGSTLAGTDRSSGFSFFGKSAAPTGYDQYTAVYDISAKVVYMPDGTKLEAHSGLGDRLDDPRFVSERGRGATPPHVYELSPREALFHGVQALRLTPVGGDADIYGRAGLLAHTFMLGPNGDSNGCVSFKDYDAFLRAYQQGQIKRLAVVAKVD